MKGKDLISLIKENELEEFNLNFTMIDGYSEFPNHRLFKIAGIYDIGYTDNLIILDGIENCYYCRKNRKVDTVVEKWGRQYGACETCKKDRLEEQEHFNKIIKKDGEWIYYTGEEDEKILYLLKGLTEKEKTALKEAVSVIYFNDRSDYINGLWSVVFAILGEDVDKEEIDIKKLLYILDPELTE